MPILFIHGVAVRDQHDPDWQAVRQVTKGIHWPDIQAALREYVAPALNAAHPEQVSISQVYWGDLGAHLAQSGESERQERPLLGQPDGLDNNDLGEALEYRLRPATPVAQWPELIEAVWNVVRDINLRLIFSGLPAQQQWGFLEAAVRGRMPAPLPLTELRPHLPTRLQLQRRKNLNRAMVTVRRPIESFVPIFLGDVLTYLNARGTPQQPGPIPQRVTRALLEAHQSRQHSQEPLVVLTHSMGGQLMYDALTAFLPANPEMQDVRVDFWCAAASQVGFFAELGVFLNGAPLADSPSLGYFWNVWSYTDLLSFRAAGIVQGAHDTAFPLGGNVQAAHLAYLNHPDFYRTLAAKIRVHGGGRQSQKGL